MTTKTDSHSTSSEFSEPGELCHVALTACLLQAAFHEEGMQLFHAARMVVEPAALPVFASLPLLQCPSRCAPHTSRVCSCAVPGTHFPLLSLRTEYHSQELDTRPCSNNRTCQVQGTGVQQDSHAAAHLPEG